MPAAPVFEAEVALAFRSGEGFADLVERHDLDLGDAHDAERLARHRGHDPAVAGLAQANLFLLEVKPCVSRAALRAVAGQAGKLLDDGHLFRGGNLAFLDRFGKGAGMMRRCRVDPGGSASLAPEGVDFGGVEKQHVVLQTGLPDAALAADYMASGPRPR